MAWVGLALLITAIAGTAAGTYWFGDSEYGRYIQAGFFLLGVAGIFMLERKSLKRRAEKRRKNGNRKKE